MHHGGWMEFSNLGLWQSVCLAMSGELFVTCIVTGCVEAHEANLVYREWLPMSLLEWYIELMFVIVLIHVGQCGCCFIFFSFKVQQCAVCLQCFFRKNFQFKLRKAWRVEQSMFVTGAVQAFLFTTKLSDICLMSTLADCSSPHNSLGRARVALNVSSWLGSRAFIREDYSTWVQHALSIGG